MTSAEASGFVGRATELGIIEEAINAPDHSSQLLLISGPSGIGKTHLLREIPNLYHKKENVVVAKKRIDCYETSAHIPFSIEGLLANELGPFEDFDRSFRDWYRIKLFSAQSPLFAAREVVHAREAVQESFLSDYNSRAQQQRIVLRFDTVEIARRSDLWDRILELAPHLKNTVLLLAGQGIESAQPELERRYQKYSMHVKALTLGGFEQDEIDDYVQNQADDLPIDQSLREKICILTNGRPVLVILAIEWLKRSVPIERLETLSVEEINALSSNELSQLRQEVEQALVEGILTLSDEVDQAILQMAWVHRRFDIDILSTLFGTTSSECKQLLARLKELPFTRILPDDVCVLHDNVRDLVNKYDWEIVDPNGTYRLELDRKIVEYYDQLISERKSEVESLTKHILPSSLVEQPSEERQLFDDVITAETERWIYEAEGLFYALRADPEQGVTRFARAFDEATDSNRDLRGLLVSEITDQTEEWRARLSAEADYAINIRLAKALADAGQIQTAHDRFLDLLRHESAVGKHRADLLVQLGNTAIRLGEISDGEKYFGESLQLSLSLKDPLWTVRSEHALAWLRRLQGRWSEAAEYYRSALKTSSSIVDERERVRVQAWLENGLGYIEHLRGRSKEAEQRCLKALDLWQRLNAPIQLGSIYSTLGEIMTGQDGYAEALRYYTQAINIFQEQRAREWQIIVYHQMAYSRWCTRDLDNAWQNIRKCQKLAAEHNITRELPAIFHRLGLLVWDDFLDLRQAAQHFERGVEESRRCENGQFLLENLVALVDVAYRSNDYLTMEQRANEMRTEIQNKQLNYPLLEGRLERILAQAAYDCVPPDYNKALDHYLKAIPLIAQHGGYALYQLSTELLFLGHRMQDLPPVVALSWCSAMRAAWEPLEISRAHPELLTFCSEQIDAAKARQEEEKE